MSSNDDIKILLKTLYEQEEMLYNLYGKLLSEIKNEKILDVIKWIREDEAKHMENAREMIRILEEQR